MRLLTRFHYGNFFSIGILYTGTFDGKILAQKPDDKNIRILTRLGGNCSRLTTCGRPLGMRIHPITGRLLVADAYLGLYSVDTETGKFETLIGPRDRIHVTFFDDLDILPDGSAIYFSEASTRFPLHLLMYDVSIS